MKKVVASFLAGVLMATAISVYADDGLEKIEAYVRKGLPITLNGNKVELENPPVIVDGSTYLRLRDVAKITGVEVNWNEYTQTVELKDVTIAKQDSAVPINKNSGGGAMQTVEVSQIDKSIAQYLSDIKDREYLIQVQQGFIDDTIKNKSNYQEQQYTDKITKLEQGKAKYQSEISELKAKIADLEKQKAELLK